MAQVVTRLTAGTGLVALQGAIALDRDAYDITFIAGASDLTGAGAPIAKAGESEVRLNTVRRAADAVKHAPENDMIGEAYDAGFEVMQVPALVPEISPRKDRAGLKVLEGLLAEGGYDVVHTHNPKAGVLGRIAAHRIGVPRIVHTWHGFPWHRFMPSLKRRLYVAAERHAAKYTDAFLAVGKSVAVQAMELGLADGPRIRAIDSLISPVDYPSGNGARSRARSRLGLPPGVRVVGVVGRVAPQKAPDVFLKALARLQGDVYGVWVGDGPDREAMKTLAERLGVAGRMLWPGHRDDIGELLPAFDVFALASIYEGVPCVLAEAMTAGLPVVATAVDGVPDVVTPGETGILVPPRQPAAFAAALRTMLDHPLEAARMAAAGQSSLGDRFTAPVLARALDEVYRGVSRRPVGSPAARTAAVPAAEV